MNAAVELETSDLAVTKLVLENFENFVSVLRHLFQRGQREGDIHSRASADALARLAHMVVTGLRVRARVSRSEYELIAPIDAFIDSL